MTARDALAEGLLQDAIATQRIEVAQSPHDSAARLFLFELLVLAGSLSEAKTELLAIPSTLPEWTASQRAFRKLLSALHHRDRLRKPYLLLPPPKHLKYRWLAVSAATEGDDLLAMDFADRADSLLPEVSGFVDGREFLGLRDSDDRFAGVLELLIGRRWVWVALEQVKSLRLKDAQTVLDLSYRSGVLVLTDGREFGVTVPLVYPNSAAHGDDFALAQTVDWASLAGLTAGLGAKVLTAGDEEVALSECRMFEIR